MKIFSYGDPAAELVLVQPVDEHDLTFIESEVSEIGKRTTTPFSLLAVLVDDWNRDLSPWPAPAVFGKDDFKGGAPETLNRIMEFCADSGKTYIIGGYSLAGLFALWASTQTNLFAGVTAASPSAWYPGLREFLKDHPMRTNGVYLSLGDREEKTKNPVMATVGDAIREIYGQIGKHSIDTTLEWNEGNHFRDADIRTAKAFVWAIETCCRNKNDR